MADQLSGIAIIICIAFGSLTGILLFIFAKRQIMRFALKSRRGPHVPIGLDAPKKFHLEIERRLNAVKNIRCQPCLLKESNRKLFDEMSADAPISPNHLYRMKVVEDVRELCNIISSKDATKFYKPGDDIKLYLLRLYKEGALPYITIGQLNKLLITYECARHEPVDFTHVEYCQFLELLQYVKTQLSESNEASSAFRCMQPKESLEIEKSEIPLLNRFSYSSPSNVNSKLRCETSV